MSRDRMNGSRKDWIWSTRFASWSSNLDLTPEEADRHARYLKENVACMDEAAAGHLRAFVENDGRLLPRSRNRGKERNNMRFRRDSQFHSGDNWR